MPTPAWEEAVATSVAAGAATALVAACRAQVGGAARECWAAATIRGAAGPGCAAAVATRALEVAALVFGNIMTDVTNAATAAALSAGTLFLAAWARLSAALVFGDVMTVEADAATPVLSAVRLFLGDSLCAALADAWVRRSAALGFGDVMAVDTDAAPPVLSEVRLVSGATLHSSLAAAVRVDSSGYGCGLSFVLPSIHVPLRSPPW